MSFTPPYPYGVMTAAVAAPYAEPAKPACIACMNKAGELAAKNEQINRLKGEAADLREQITDLQALANAAQPAPADFAELRARVHRLANEEATARRALWDTRNELQDALGKLARAERTIANRDALIAAGGAA